MSLQQYRVEDMKTDSEPSDWVRRGFRAGSFMPLQVCISRPDFDTPCVERREDDVTQAIIYDAELLADAKRNGESKQNVERPSLYKNAHASLLLVLQAIA